jgi:hypothetical protein
MRARNTPESKPKRIESLISSGPFRILQAAIKAVPAVRYALGVLGIIAAISLAGTLVTDFRVAVFGTLIALGLMALLVIFAAATRLVPRFLIPAAIVFVYAFLTLAIATAFLIFTSVFFKWPVNLRHWIVDDYENNQRKPHTLLEVTNANLYADNYDKGQWERFDPIKHRNDERFWIGVDVKAKGDVIIDKVSVGYLIYDSFVVGYFYKEQEEKEVYPLSDGTSKYISVWVEKTDWPKAFKMLSQKTTISLFSSDGKEVGSAEIGPIDFKL